MPSVSVRKLCTLLNINRQWYYQHRRCASKNDHDRPLCLALQELRKDFAGYGYRRMTKALRRDGWKINHKRVERVMKQAGLICRRKPRYVHTTDPKHGEPVYPNLIKDLPIESLNQCWVADLTYVHLPEGFVAPFLFARRLLPRMYWVEPGASDGEQLTAPSVGDGFSSAPDCPGLIHHSDRGRSIAVSRM
jgi:transposase InsO family protein